MIGKSGVLVIATHACRVRQRSGGGVGGGRAPLTKGVEVLEFGGGGLKRRAGKGA